MSSTGLKILALILMLIDHIGEFIPGTPIWFRWIGRVSAPIFIFCSAWGFYYTRDRKKYLFRMYICGISMAIVRMITNQFRMPSYSVEIDNNIFVTLYIIFFVVEIIERIISKPKEGKRYLFYYIIYQVISTLFIVLLEIISPIKNVDNMFYGAFLANIFFNEGGIPYIILGVILYFCRKRKKDLLLAYSGFSVMFFLFNFLSVSAHLLIRVNQYFSGIAYEAMYVIFRLLRMENTLITPLSVESLCTYNYEWALIFALPFMLLYNHNKGRGLKYLFYLFYPIHIVILYCLGNIVSVR